MLQNPKIRDVAGGLVPERMDHGPNPSIRIGAYSMGSATPASRYTAVVILAHRRPENSG
jgi:hypothetical protein